MLKWERKISGRVILQGELCDGNKMNLVLTKEAAIELSNALYLALGGDPEPRIGW